MNGGCTWASCGMCGRCSMAPRIEREQPEPAWKLACAICGGKADGTRTVASVGHVCSSRCAQRAIDSILAADERQRKATA